MRPLQTTSLLAFMSLLALRSVSAQTVPDFDMSAYKSFLAAHQDMSSSQLLTLHPAGSFARVAPTQFSAALHFQALDSMYTLTPDEKTLLSQHGFVVTERIQSKTFAAAFLQIYQADMPLFISTDAILHALHMSYDLILETIEHAAIIPKLGDALTQIHSQLPALANRYGQGQGMGPSLFDLDLYLTVARRLLGQTVDPLYPSTLPASDYILQKIAAAQWVKGASPLFADSIRLVDYSQFTVRGHYTHSEELSKYFQSMMWLGRTEFYLFPPKGTEEQYKEAQIQRQAIAALLMKEAVGLSGAETELGEIDDILRFFVGDPDNVTLRELKGLTADIGMTGADEMLDTLKFRGFQSALLKNAWAYQRILSQMLVSGSSLAVDQIQPASSFLLLGQRFVIDSYVTGSVVYDKIVYQNSKVRRMLPSTQDVVFALGNDASAQLLVPELDSYHYATNLAALRYLVDSYEPQFWKTTFYNGWLNAVRSLTPPQQRDGLPAFMRTAAWWQEKLNTQLASWAELRHDNLLYAKQSYTGIPACSYPFAYVEPIPEFYKRIAVLADTASVYFQRLSIADMGGVPQYFEEMKLTADTLTAIAEKELAGSGLDESEKGFLRRTMYLGPFGCSRGGGPNGWYADLYYGGPPSTTEQNTVVADVHTSPADAAGNMVGWVLHAGTGPLNMAFVVTDMPEAGPVAFVGPVLSYYEQVTTNFKRLTDEEWQAQFAALTAARPSWVNLYLADASGRSRGEGQTLVTGVRINPPDQSLPQSALLAQNYPNPFNSSTMIQIVVPGLKVSTNVDLSLYDIQGRLVRRLLRQALSPGSYLVRWDGRADDGRAVASGVYVSRLKTEGPVQTRKMALLR